MNNKRILTAAAALMMLASCSPLDAFAEQPVSAPASSSVSTCSSIALACPSVTSAVKGRTAVRLRWSKVRGASGYKIYRKTKSGWKCVKKLKGSGSCRARIAGLKSGTRYKFRLRAYKKSSDNVIFSKYSPVKVLTTRESKTAWCVVSQTAAREDIILPL